MSAPLRVRHVVAAALLRVKSLGHALRRCLASLAATDDGLVRAGHVQASATAAPGSEDSDRRAGSHAALAERQPAFARPGTGTGVANQASGKRSASSVIMRTARSVERMAAARSEMRAWGNMCSHKLDRVLDVLQARLQRAGCSLWRRPLDR